MRKREPERISQFIEKCKEHNLKITPQRIAIYRELVQSKEHPSADSMFRIIKKEFPNISFDTVNRTLNTFAEYGFIDVVEGYGEPKRFDPDRESHHHAHCIICGKIIDFQHDNWDDIEIPENIIQGFSVLTSRVVLNGICGNCTNSR